MTIAVYILESVIFEVYYGLYICSEYDVYVPPPCSFTILSLLCVSISVVHFYVHVGNSIIGNFFVLIK